MSSYPERDIRISARYPMRRLILHLSLFAATLFTTTVAGVQWLNLDPFELGNLPEGIVYALLMLFVLSSHEMGHYLAAQKHKVDATLPFFLPFPSVFGVFPFGTLGAVIRIKSSIANKRVLFDIGVAGPFAGFVASIAVLAYGYATLPPVDYLYAIHPEYVQLGTIPAEGIRFGESLFFSLVALCFTPEGAFVPPMNEVYHYPFLCVGWFGLLVTSMNLIPVGQLDGGHITFAMFGNLHYHIENAALIALVILGILGLLPFFGVDTQIGWPGWLFWAILLFAFVRSSRFRRPHAQDDHELDGMRKALGFTCIAIFVGTFSIVPISI